MTTEFDLPCAECGRELVRREIPAEDGSGEVVVAECPDCGGRYYPEDALGRS